MTCYGYAMHGNDEVMSICTTRISNNVVLSACHSGGDGGYDDGYDDGGGGGG